MRGACSLAPAFALLLVVTAHAESPPPPDSAPVPGVPLEERRCEELSHHLEALVSRHELQAPEDILLAEAIEIGAVANELRAEGDLPSAEALLEEAIALLKGAGPSL